MDFTKYDLEVFERQMTEVLVVINSTVYLLRLADETGIPSDLIRDAQYVAYRRDNSWVRMDHGDFKVLASELVKVARVLEPMRRVKKA